MSDAIPLAIFRADASSEIGWGHVRRCAAIACVLKGLGWQCCLATIADNSKLKFLPSGHFDKIKVISGVNDETSIIRDFWTDGCQLLIIDHYDRDQFFENSLCGWAEKIIVIEDLEGRVHNCDVLLDTSPGRHSECYSDRIPPNSLLLLGPLYAPLMPYFSALRPNVVPRIYSAPAKRILVSLGATNPDGLLDKVLDAIEGSQLSLFPDLILAYQTPEINHLIERVRKLGGKTYFGVDNVAPLMVEADFAIGAGGISAWERCVLGLPTLIIIIAENQRSNCEALEKLGAAQIVRPQVDLLIDAISKLASDPLALEQMSRVAALQSDGLGARRVCQLLSPETVARDGGVVRLRPASIEDSEIIFLWQQKPETRQFSRNSSPPTITEHKRWFKKKLQNPCCFMNLILHDERPAGFVRLDPWKNGYEVSIAVDPNQYRLGLARIALKLLRELLPEDRFWAHIHKNNFASKNLFQNAGFKCSEKEGWLVQTAGEVIE